MMTKEKAIEILLLMCPNWYGCATSSQDNSSGLVVIWDPSILTIQDFESCMGIILSGYYRGTSYRIQIMNIYAPYCSHKPFWDMVDASGLLDIKPLIIAEDLNFTIDTAKCWGKRAKSDPLASYFKDLFQCKFLRDIASIPLCPTWRNSCSRVEGIIRRIDRFFVYSQMCLRMNQIHSWYFFFDTSDHDAIMIEWFDDLEHQIIPFKFNPMWINDPDFQ